MVRLPWRRDQSATDEPRGDDDLDVEPIVVCEFQDGTLFVYEDQLFIERAGPSKFADKAIPRNEITDVTYSKGIAIGYIQFEQVGVENDSSGFLTSPIDENTLHFGRRDRECAERVRDEVLFEGS